MSEINKTTQNFNRNKTEEAYAQGSGDTVFLGTEIETWLVRPPISPGSSANMMTPQDSQNILSQLADDKAIIFSEEKGQRIAGKKPGLPIVYVEADAISYQLELCGVLEAATKPYALSDITILLQDICTAQQITDKTARENNLVPYDGSVLGSATVADCETNMVKRERLGAEWDKFKRDGCNSPGLRTMGLAASTQVSVSYKNEQALQEIFQVGNLLSPLLIASFANSAGFEEKKRTNRISRAQWWLDHNQYAPRGGVPDFALDIMFSAKQENVSAKWLDYVASTPMVYFIDENNEPEFSTSPTFNDLCKNGLGTEANYFLAESLTWPDVKLIGGKRVEMRMCDTGPWQPTALTVICAGLLTNETGRQQTLDMLYKTGIKPKTYTQARADVCYEGLDTAFGNTTLRAILPNVFDLACQNAGKIGICDGGLLPLQIMRDNPYSDFELKKNIYTNAAQADAALCQKTPAMRQPLCSS